MRFFKFNHNNSQERQWARATSVQPKSHQIAWQCSTCGRAAKYPSGIFDVTVEGGPLFPDFLGCGAYPFLIVSERVVRGWEQCGITSFRAIPVGITNGSGGHPGMLAPPKYYRIEVTGECRIDFTASGAVIKSICGRCGEMETDVPYIKTYYILEGSWDGSPLFRDHRFFPMVTFCTAEAKDLALNEHYTNLRFQPVT